MNRPAPIAADLAAAVQTCRARLERHPASGLSALVEQIAGEILPRLRPLVPEGGRVDLELSELASTLSILAGDAGLRRGRGSSVRLARRHLIRLQELVPAIAEAEDTAGDLERDPAAEDRARGELFFVAPPDRPPTEAHVLRHAPRAVKVWSPARRTGSRPPIPR